MRKFLSIIRTDVGEFPQASSRLPTPTPSPILLSTSASAPAPAPFFSVISSSPLPSPPPSSLPSSVSPPINLLVGGGDYLFLPANSLRNNAFELITLSLIGCIIFLCFFSFTIIFYLCLQSRRWCHLRRFNSFWTTRSLLVSFAFLWSLSEALRLNIFRGFYLFPFLPSMSVDQQINICKFQQVFSLGFFEPGFLVTLLMLVNVSINNQFHRRIWVMVLSFCSPVLALQTLTIFYSPLKTNLPNTMHESFLQYTDHYGNTVVLCKYPILSVLVFATFTGAYILAFFITSWKVVSFVINKNITNRINALAFTVMVALPLQLFVLALSTVLSPANIAHRFTVLAAFLCVTCFVVTGDFVLVITPITEALVAGRHACPWRLRPVVSSIRRVRQYSRS